jgi:hypothetical protein
MFEQAAGFAFLAALSPGAVVVMTGFLGSESPRRTALLFLLGAVVITVAAGIVIVVALHAGGLNHPRQRQPRYGLRLGLGILSLGAGVVLVRRGPRTKDPDKKKGLLSRLMSRPGPIAAISAGIIVFVPSAAFIAAVQAIATARASVDSVAGALALVVVIDVMLAWVPLVLFILWPDATTLRLRGLHDWLGVHGHAVLVGVLALAGILLAVNGAVGLAT